MTSEISTSLQSFITQVLLVVITIGLPILVAGIIYLGRLLGNWVAAKVRLSKTQTDDLILIGLEQVARLFVKSAEQSGLIGAITNEAASKKQYALDRITEYAESKGWHDIGIGVLDAAIESAVRDGVHKGFNTSLALPSVFGEHVPQTAGLSEETGQALLKVFGPSASKTELDAVAPRPTHADVASASPFNASPSTPSL